MIESSCITDMPICSVEGDVLDNNLYAKGLVAFLKDAETPITIGVQGGWGSGKTSLINMMKKQLDEEGETITILINAWEHSLFQTGISNASVATSLLGDIIQSISDIIIEKSDEKFISHEVKKKALAETSILKKTIFTAIGAIKLGGATAAKLFGGIEVSDQDLKLPEEEKSTSSIIKSLKRNINNSVKVVCDDNTNRYKKFVIFIDDLDRVHPSIAIEILDILKNVFDVKNCVFVLAIDYDIVVKGLESKFGKKTKENEREFRQYFDKIIQIPFGMPVGRYREKTESLVKSLLSQSNSFSKFANLINYRILSEVAFCTTEGVPRSVKRIVNTTALLSKINSLSKTAEDEDEDLARNAKAIEVIFIITAIQNNFHEIYIELCKKPDFTKWANSLSSGDSASKDSKIIPWQGYLSNFCSENSWLDRNKNNIVIVFELLLETLKIDGHKIDISLLSDALEISQVTEVDSETKLNIDNEDTKRDVFAYIFRQLHHKLLLSLNIDESSVDIEKCWPKKWGSKSRRYVDRRGSAFISQSLSPHTEYFSFEVDDEWSKFVLDLYLPKKTPLLKKYLENSKYPVVLNTDGGGYWWEINFTLDISLYDQNGFIEQKVIDQIFDLLISHFNDAKAILESFYNDR